MIYYLQDEYTDVSDNCTPEAPQKQKAPKANEKSTTQQTTMFGALPSKGCRNKRRCSSPKEQQKQCAVPSCPSTRNRQTSPIQIPIVVSAPKPIESKKSSTRYCARKVSTQKACIPPATRESPVKIRQPSRPICATRPTVQTQRSRKDCLNGQFPCPCLTSDMRPHKQEDLWDAQFYRWWGWHWLKEKENMLRNQMAKEGRKFSQEFPIQLAKGFAEEERRKKNGSDECSEKLIKEEIYENYYDAPRQRYSTTAAKPPGAKQEKKWSLMKTINNAIKSRCSRDRKCTEEPALCRCREKLPICGPYNKKCHGIEGVFMPCGFDCDCKKDKSCLEPYIKELCPCDQPCPCPKDVKQTTISEIPRAVCTANCQHPIAPYIHEHQATVVPTIVHQHYSDKGYTTDESYSCRPSSTTTQQSTHVSVHKVTIKSDSEDCCCSCDEELCDCCCCCCMDISKKGIQTSRFCLRENCTQTDKAPKRCCRCCRCCTLRGKKNCFQCMKTPDKDGYGGGGVGASVGGGGGGVCGGGGGGGSDVIGGTGCTGKVSFSKNSGKSFIHDGNKKVYVGTPGCCPTNVTKKHDTSTHTAITHHHPHNNTNNSRKTSNSAPNRKQTMMVRTNSIQCMPTQENKSTSFNYEDTIPESYFDRFISQLNGLNSELNRNPLGEIRGELEAVKRDTKNSGDFEESAIKFNTGDITALTKAKLRNYFLQGDVYLSPVSGRNYDLSYRTVDMPPTITSTKILKPLDVDEQLQQSNLPTQCFASEVEHTKLMTAICEAILSNNRDTDIEEPTKETKENKTQEINQTPVQTPLETLHTITEVNESVNSIKVVDNGSNIKPSSEDELQTANVNKQLIFEIQQNFKDKINKLEEKVEVLIHGTNNNTSTDSKYKIREGSRSKGPQPQSQSNTKNKKKTCNYKPLITKTGLFGVLPRRSQIFNGYASNKISPNCIPNQQGDVRSENPPKSEDDSIVKYEKLVADNQKHVDELLGQLQVLHSCKALLNKSKETKMECTDTCCLQIQEEMIYKPNLGTGEHFAFDKITSNELFGQLENVFAGNVPGEQIFYLNEINYDDLAPSTSTSINDTGILTNHTDQQSQQIPLDFSSIVFAKCSTESNEGEQEVKEYKKDNGTIRSASYPNFILKNLPSYATNISDSYNVQKILRNGQSTNANTSFSFFAEDSSSDSLLKLSDSTVYNNVNSKNKV